MKTSEQHPFYITFGTADHFPYGFHDYVVVYAKDEASACESFRAKYPDAHEGYYNFAFIYDEDSWNGGVKAYYEGVKPADIVLEMKSVEHEDPSLEEDFFR